MATVTEKMHPFVAAKSVGREPYKVNDLSLAEFGRKEIRLAEQEMPGLMALRRQHGAQEAAVGRARHGQPAHDRADRGPHRNAH